MRGRILLVFAALLLSGCQPPPKEVRVVRQGALLLLDLQFSIWDVLGGRDRTYSMATLEVFDRERVIWRLEATGDFRDEVTFPIALGRPLPGFAQTGRLSLRRDVQYAVASSGIGRGRVDFVLEGSPAQPRNIFESDRQITGPCGSEWGPIECPQVAPPPA